MARWLPNVIIYVEIEYSATTYTTAYSIRYGVTARQRVKLN